mgnify:CR=1 FL=1
MGIRFKKKQMTIKFQLNGIEYLLDRVINISELLLFLSLNKDNIALEHNTLLVPKKNYSSIYIKESDQLEIVSIVGGG